MAPFFAYAHNFALLLTLCSVCFAVLPFKWHVAGVRIMGGKASAKEPDLTIYYAVFKGFGELYEMTDSALQSIGTI